jgi:putative nucleotidyltransferase with HDIG domain
MGRVSVDDLRPGMILSEDVRDINSRLLLSKNQEITPKQIRILKIWGVTEVAMIDRGEVDRREDPYINDEIRQQVQHTTKTIFKNIDLEHPAVAEVFRLSVLHRCRNYRLSDNGDIKSSSDDLPAKLAPTDIRKKFERLKLTLPEIPTIVSDLNRVSADPFSSANDIAKIVRKSPSLTAILLRIVNSAFYGFPFKIDNIPRAITLIGSREITGLALGISVMKYFKDVSRKDIDMNSFLMHSLACGLVCRILASQMNMTQTEQMFVAGLLHDIGRLVIYKYFPDQTKILFTVVKNESQSLYNAEKSCLRCRHPEVGKILLNKWKLPKSLTDSVYFHHRPANSYDPVQAGIVHIADIVINGLGLGSSGEKTIPRFDESVWEKLKITPSIFKPVIDQVIHQLADFEALIVKEI